MHHRAYSRMTIPKLLLWLLHRYNRLHLPGEPDENGYALAARKAR
jgi:hypothetical protein